MSGYTEFGFGSGDDNLGGRSKRFKAKEGEKYRVSFVWWPGIEDGNPDLEAATPKFIGCKRLYLQGVGYFIDKGPEYVKIAGGSPSKMQVATLICKWPTDSNGSLDKARFQNGDFSVMPWIFSTDKYRNIEQNHREFPLGQHDLTISCTDTQYQKMTLSPCRESLFRKLVEKDKAGPIIEAVRSNLSSINSELAQDLTIDQIRERLGRSDRGASPMAGGGVAPANSADFDNMLDDILG
jgi:hypothetical protein